MAGLKNFKWDHLGMLVLRLAFGLLAMNYGIRYLMGGFSSLVELAQPIRAFGIPIGLTLFGFIGALIYTIGGLFLILGLWFRTTCLAFFVMMLIALKGTPDIFRPVTPHALSIAILAFCLILIGPGDHKPKA